MLSLLEVYYIGYTIIIHISQQMTFNVTFYLVNYNHIQDAGSMKSSTDILVFTTETCLL